jgi:hypothetical protein
MLQQPTNSKLRGSVENNNPDRMGNGGRIAVAGVLIAAIAVVATLLVPFIEKSIEASDPPPLGPTTTTFDRPEGSPGLSPPTQVAPNGEPSPPGQFRQLYVAQELRVPAGNCPYQTEIDVDELQVGTTQANRDLNYGRQCGDSDRRRLRPYGPAALVDSSVTSAEQCDKAINRSPIGNTALKLSVGDVVCVRSNEDRISLIQVAALARDDAVTITVTTWEPN